MHPNRARALVAVAAVTIGVLSVAALVTALDHGDSTSAGGTVPRRETTTTVPTTRAPTTTAPTTTATGDVPPEPATTSPAPVTVPPATTAPPPPAPTGPAFQASIETVTAEQLHASWRPGCPVPVEQLRALDLSHWGFDGQVHTGRLIVHEAQAQRMVAAFSAIFQARFPIQRMEPIDTFGGSDDASMAANNTSGFNCRFVKGTERWSEHSFGQAVDINPIQNPYVKGGTVDPPEGAPYASRPASPGVIHAGDAVVRAFEAQGWAWGGYWKSGPDYQHFSATGR